MAPQSKHAKLAKDREPVKRQTRKEEESEASVHSKGLT